MSQYEDNNIEKDNREVIDEFMRRKLSQYEENPIHYVKKENVHG